MSAAGRDPVPGTEVEQAAREQLRRDAVRYLRVRERTAQEVRRHLQRRGHAAQAVAAAVEELLERGYIDDRRFAELYLRDRRRLRPMSARAALAALQAKGIARATAQAALEASDPPWDDAALARAALERRWSRWAPAQRARRGARFLQARGFAFATVRAVLAELGADGGGAGEASAYGFEEQPDDSE